MQRRCHRPWQLLALYIVQNPPMIVLLQRIEPDLPLAPC